MPKLRTPSPRLLFCCIPRASKAWLTQFHNQRKSPKSATKRKSSWLNRWRTLSVSSKVLEWHPIVCNAGAGRQDRHVRGFQCWGLGQARITNCMGIDLSWSLSGRYPGEGNGYARLENAWQAIVKDWDMAEHAGVQAPMHAGTQAPAHTRRHPSMQPHTHARTQAPTHASTYIAMHPRTHPGTGTSTQMPRMRTLLRHAGAHAPCTQAHAPRTQAHAPHTQAHAPRTQAHARTHARGQPSPPLRRNGWSGKPVERLTPPWQFGKLSLPGSWGKEVGRSVV